MSEKNKKFGKYFEYIKGRKMLFLYFIIILMAVILVVKVSGASSGFSFNSLTGNSVKITGESIQQGKLNVDNNELKEKRTYNSQTYKNPDGTFTAVIGARDIFFFDGSEYVEIANISEPRIEKKEIILNKKPKSNVFDFGTYTLHQGVNVTIENDELVLRDANNKTLKILPKPFATDANGSIINGSYIIELNNFRGFKKVFFNNYGKDNETILKLSVEIDSEWLNNAEYPVVVDPTVIIGYPDKKNISIDGYAQLWSGSYSRFVGDSTFKIGGTLSLGQQQKYRGFIEFNTSGIPDDVASINDVDINISVQSTTYGVGDFVAIIRMNNSQPSNNTGDSARFPNNQSGNNDLFNILNGTDGGVYLKELTDFQTIGPKYLDLGTSADTDLKNQLVIDFFAVGINGSDESTDAKYIEINSSEAVDGYNDPDISIPKLIVTYTGGGCDPEGAGGWTCSSTCTFTGGTYGILDNIYVQDACVLTLDGATFSFQFVNKYIYVYPGGQIYIKNNGRFN